MKYETVNVINSRVNLFEIREELRNFIEYIQNKFISEIDNNIWKSPSREKLVESFKILLDELNKYYICNENAINNLSDIERIKKLLEMNKQLEEENMRLEMSTNPADKLKLSSNKEKINENNNNVNLIEMKIRKDWE